MTSAHRDLIFVSYSHRHPEWRDRLLSFLRPAAERRGLQLWADPYIEVGEIWRREIDEKIGRACAAIFLVSQEMFDSSFIRDHEIPPILEAREAGHTQVFCVPVSTSLHEETPLAPLQWTRSARKPLDVLAEPQWRHELGQICKAIRDQLPDLSDEPPSPVSPVVSDLSGEPQRTLLPEADGPLGKLFGVPTQRPYYVPRPDEVARLRAAILGGPMRGVSLTGSARVGLQGQGGVGKTSLCIELVEDEALRRVFSDGILWLTVGWEPDLRRLQLRLIDHLSGERPVIENVDHGRDLLARLVSEKACLLVLDDVWRLDHVRAFEALGPTGCCLITTRDASIERGVGAWGGALDVASPEVALAILAAATSQPAKTLPQAAAEVARECSHLPLALSVAGGLVRDGSSWQDALEALRHGKLQFIDHPHQSVFQSIDTSVRALTEDQRARYLELAVFNPDVHVPGVTVERLWRHTGRLQPFEAHMLLAALRNKGLLYLGEDGGISLHDLQRDYIAISIADIESAHGDLIDAHLVPGAPGDAVAEAYFFSPHEPYLWQWIVEHLIEACRADVVDSLLLDFGWIQAKLRAAGIQALLADYEWLVGDEAMDLVAHALGLSAEVLARDPDQLASQLLSRLQHSDLANVKALCRGAQQGPGRP